MSGAVDDEGSYHFLLKNMVISKCLSLRLKSLYISSNRRKSSWSAGLYFSSPTEYTRTRVKYCTKNASLLYNQLTF